jgi:hypothetical protein
MLKWNKFVKDRIINKAEEGVMRFALLVFNESQKITPFDDGELTLGARVSSQKNIGEFFASVSYGNNSVSQEYAVIQHENLRYKHKAPERAKYLYTALKNNEDKFLEHVAYKIREVL